MIRDLYLREVLLFLFTFSDEDLVVKAATKTINECEKKVKSRLDDEVIDHNQLVASVVFYTYNNWKKYKLHPTQASLNFSHSGSWILPPNVDLGLWRQFLKEAEPEEFLTVLWVKILKFSEAQVARGVGRSIGTVRHRLNRGLRVMSQMQY